jgi:hypothetical protein
MSIFVHFNDNFIYQELILSFINQILFLYQTLDLYLLLVLLCIYFLDKNFCYFHFLKYKNLNLNFKLYYLNYLVLY